MAPYGAARALHVLKEPGFIHAVVLSDRTGNAVPLSHYEPATAEEATQAKSTPAAATAPPSVSDSASATASSAVPTAAEESKEGEGNEAGDEDESFLAFHRRLMQAESLERLKAVGDRIKVRWVEDGRGTKGGQGEE